MSATWLRLGAAMTLTTFAACATTVTRKSQRPLDAEIVGGSPDNVFFAQPGGAECRVPRSDITDSHYPGTVSTIAGLIVTGYALFRLQDRDWHCGALSGGDCAQLWIPAPLGLALLVPGVIALNLSMAKAASTSRVDTDPSPVPICQSPAPPPPTGRPQGRAAVPARGAVTPIAPLSEPPNPPPPAPAPSLEAPR